MSSRPNQPTGLNQAGTSETRMTVGHRLAEVPPELHDLFERGEISSEEFALHLEMADAAEANSQRVRFRRREDRFSLAAPRK
jgi:hypothetical protein